MKKFTIVIIAIALLLSTIPSGAVLAASKQTLPVCSITKWQVLYNGAWVSGGCTCHVAERVKAVTGKNIPWNGNAGAWWGNSTWAKSTNEPRKGAIAGFGYGHVAYVESVTLKNQSSPVKIKSADYTSNYVKYSATLYKVTETYTVRLSHKGFSRIIKGDNSVWYTSFESRLEKYYWVSVNLGKLDTVRYRNLPDKPADKWTTDRVGNAAGLQGFIFP